MWLKWSRTGPTPVMTTTLQAAATIPPKGLEHDVLHVSSALVRGKRLFTKTTRCLTPYPSVIVHVTKAEQL